MHAAATSQFAERLDAARELHRAGALEQARAAYDALLAEEPENPDLLGLTGVLALQDGRGDDAEAALRSALQAGGDIRVRQRNLNTLFALLDGQGRRGDAATLAAMPPPCATGAAAPSPQERRTLLSLVEAFARYGQPAHGLAVLDAEPGLLDSDGEAAMVAGRLRLVLGEPEGAVRDLERAARLGQDGWRTRVALAGAYRALGRGREALEATRRFALALPIVAMPKKPTQQATVLVLNNAPVVVPEPLLPEPKLHFNTNYIGQAALRMGDDYRFVSLFADIDAPLDELPRADVVFNNMANSERLLAPGRLDQALDLVERLDLPVINHPKAMAGMTRQKVAVRLQGIPGLRVPKIARYRRREDQLRQIAADVDSGFDWPVIVRHTMAQQTAKSLLRESKSAMLVRDRAELVGFLERQDWEEFYVVEYVDLRKPDGNFRKLRAILFEDEVIIGSGGYYSQWMVGAWRRLKAGQDFYRDHPHLLGEMNRLLLEPEKHLGPHVLPILEKVRDRVPLDLSGIDFDVDDQGRVVMFEVAATMNFLQRDNAPEAQRMPMEPEHRVNAAFRRLIARKLGRAAAH